MYKQEEPNLRGCNEVAVPATRWHMGRQGAQQLASRSQEWLKQRELLFSEIQFRCPHLKSSLSAGVPQDVTPRVSKTSAWNIRTERAGNSGKPGQPQWKEWGWVRGMVSHSLPCQLSDQDTGVRRDIVQGHACIHLIHV